MQFYTMKTKVGLALILLVILGMHSCSIFSSGTHGMIKGYKYQVPADTLRQALYYILDEADNIARDTGTSYNDGEYYASFDLLHNNSIYRYTVGYCTNSDSSNACGIDIDYAWENDVGGSQGRGSFKDKELEKRVITAFEYEIVKRLDSLLLIQPTYYFNGCW